ncbi:MAG TPA: hypothetical protein VN881_01165 [Candidatus Acidoferrales bacterium]|nr:hypothetical protein [Candidatus Acidoferrales bacterium]
MFERKKARASAADDAPRARWRRRAPARFAEQVAGSAVAVAPGGLVVWIIAARQSQTTELMWKEVRADA